MNLNLNLEIKKKMNGSNPAYNWTHMLKYTYEAVDMQHADIWDN